MQILDWLLLGLVAFWVVFGLVYQHRRARRGGGCCGGGCSGDCANCSSSCYRK